MIKLKAIWSTCFLLVFCSNAFALPVVNISAMDSSAAEAGQDPGSFTVTRTDDGSLGQALNVSFDFVAPPTGTDFDFSAGLGYIDTDSRYVTIAADQSSATVTITPRLDNLIEGPETLEITLTPSNAYTLGSPNEASFEITDDVAQVHISAIDPAAAEAGQDPGSFTVTRTDNGNKAATLNVSFDFVAPPTGIDFDFSAGLGYIDTDSRYVTIAANQSSATVTITPRLDNLIEGPETLEITLTPSNAYTLGSPNEASFEITDDVAQVQISAIDPAAAEAGQDPGSFTVTRTDNGNKAATLNVSFDFVAPPTGIDFDFSAGLGYIDTDSRYVTIAANQSSATVTITPRLDNLIEGPETLEITLTPSNAYTLGSPNEASFEITDDVAQVHISAIDPAAAEAGQDPGSFTVTRTDNGNKAATLNVSFDFVAPPTGIDFDFSAGLGYIDTDSRYVTIAANQSSATVTITPRLDSNEEEGDEIVNFQLTGSNAYTLGIPNQAEITIADFTNVVFKHGFEDTP